MLYLEAHACVRGSVKSELQSCKETVNRENILDAKF